MLSKIYLHMLKVLNKEENIKVTSRKINTNDTRFVCR